MCWMQLKCNQKGWILYRCCFSSNAHSLRWFSVHVDFVYHYSILPYLGLYDTKLGYWWGKHLCMLQDHIRIVYLLQCICSYGENVITKATTTTRWLVVDWNSWLRRKKTVQKFEEMRKSSNPKWTQVSTDFFIAEREFLNQMMFYRNECLHILSMNIIN